MHSDGHNSNGEQAEVEDGVDENGEAASAHVAELYHPHPRRQLEQEPRRQQDEQHHRHDDWAPVRRRHLSLPIPHTRTHKFDTVSGCYYLDAWSSLWLGKGGNRQSMHWDAILWRQGTLKRFNCVNVLVDRYAYARHLSFWIQPA